MFSFIKSKQKRKPKTDDPPRKITFGDALRLMGYLLIGCGLFALVLRIFALRSEDLDGGLARNAAGQLLFIARRESNNDIYVVDGNGSITRLMTTEAQENAATWMPNGVLIAFVAADGLQTEQIYMMSADGSNLYRLGIQREENSRSYLLYASPDGRQLLWGTQRIDRSSTRWYMVNISRGYGAPLNPAMHERWLLEGNQLIFGNNDFPDIPDTIEGQPLQRMILSPDGQYLAITTLGRPRTLDHMYTIEPDGDNLTLVESAASIGFATWSPDNRHIAYIEGTSPASATTPPDSIRVVDTQTHTANTIVDEMSAVSRIEWSPDGQQIAFTVYDADTSVYNLYAVNADGSNLRLLAENVLNTSTTRWRP